MSENKTAKKPSSLVIFGAAFLMATSAIGPGFLTQTANFTATYGSQLITVIILVIAMDIIAQMNIWSVVCVSGMRGQDVANKVLPGLGYVLALLVSLPRDCAFMQTVSLRCMDPSEVQNDDARRRLRRAKAQVRIRRGKWDKEVRPWQTAP